MQLQENDIRELINIIDWALMEGYGGLDEPVYATEILEKLVNEIDANKESDNYFKETYGF